jgi:hypothetical protein
VTVLVVRDKAGPIAVGLVALAVLAGCSQQSPGTPVASSGPTQGGSTGTGAPTTRSSASGSGASIDSCELVPDSEATKLGLRTPGTARTVGGMRSCTWQASGQFTLMVGVSERGLGDQPGENIPLTKHKAVKTTETGGYGGCGVYVAATDTQTVLIALSLVGGKPAEEACPKAVEVAKIVDSALP